jgi:hypothetical protein
LTEGGEAPLGVGRLLGGLSRGDRDLPAAIFALENDVVVSRNDVFEDTGHPAAAINALRNERRLARISCAGFSDTHAA